MPFLVLKVDVTYGWSTGAPRDEYRVALDAQVPRHHERQRATPQRTPMGGRIPSPAVGALRELGKKDVSKNG